jgi:hypothetical protein
MAPMDADPSRGTVSFSKEARAEPSKLPNLLILGAAKSGTSSLYRYVEQHPEIFMSRVKEPSFFLWADGDFEITGPGADQVEGQAIKDLDEYKSLFASVTTEAVLGEASTGYLHTQGTAERISRYVPDARLTAILRNPIHRAYSAFLHARRNGFEPLKNFEQALDEESSRIKQRWVGLTYYTDVGMYAQQLARYLRVFPSHQMRVYLYDDLVRNATMLCRDVFRFLDVEETFEPSVHTSYNRGAMVRSTALHTFLNSPRTRSIAGRLLPDRFTRPLYNRLRARNQQPVEDIPLNVRRRLVQVFESDLHRLSKMLKRDLTPWLGDRKVGPPDPDGPGMEPTNA